MSTLLNAGIAQGMLRDDISAEDVLAGMSGISSATADSPQQRDRLLDVLVDGLRRRPES